MKDLVYVSTLFLSPIFFAIIAIIGVQYYGSTESNLFITIAVLFFIICIISFFINHLKKNQHKLSFYLSIIIIVGITLNGIIVGKITSTMYRQFVVFCIPASMIGLYYAERGSIGSMVKWLDWLMILLSVSFVFVVKNLLLNIADNTGHYSQTLSYDASFAILLNLFLLSNGDKHKRFRIFNIKLYKYLCYALFPLQFAILLIGGGRGAVITFFVGLIVCVLQLKKPLIKILKYFVFFFIIAICVNYLLINFLNIDVINVLARNAERSFNFLDSSLSSFDRTSGRDFLYRQSVELILARPFWGYGLFGYVTYISPYPHNLILEWALQGGLLFMLIIVFMNLFLIIKMQKYIKHNPKNIIFILFIVLAYVPLIFSGSYLQSPLFWFVIMYMSNYCSPIEQKQVISSDNVLIKT